MTTNRLMLYLYGISTIGFVVYAYFTNTLSEYPLWGYLIGGFCFFIWLLIILSATDLMPKTKDSMPEGFKHDTTMTDYIRKKAKDAQ